MIKPLRDGILVKPHELSDLSKGGIYQGVPTTTFVANESKAKQITVGTVVAIGPGRYNDEGIRRAPDTPIGSIITFSDTCGKKVKENKEEYLIVREQDVVGFLDNEVDVELLYKD